MAEGKETPPNEEADVGRRELAGEMREGWELGDSVAGTGGICDVCRR